MSHWRLKSNLPRPTDKMQAQGERLRRAVTEGAIRSNWRDAARRHLASEPALFQYMADERAGDWRFLLPQLPRGAALCVGGALSPVPLTLAATCETVTVLAHPAEAGFLRARAQEEGFGNVEILTPDPGTPFKPLQGRRFSLVAALRAAPDLRQIWWSPARLGALASFVADGKHLYLEIDKPAILVPPTFIRSRLRSIGFAPVSCYWPKPTFSSCEMLLPLRDRRLQRYYLEYVFFAMSPARRILRQLLRVLIALGMFELTLPCYSVIARRKPRDCWSHDKDR